MKLRDALATLLLLAGCEKPAPVAAPPPQRKPAIADPCSMVSHLTGPDSLVCKVDVIDDELAAFLSAKPDRETATLLFITTNPKALSSVSKIPWARSVLIYPDTKEATADLRDLAPLTQLQKLYVNSAVRKVEDAWQFTELTELSAMSSGGVVDLSGAVALKKLRHLGLGGELADLSPLIQLPELEELTLPGVPTQLGPLASLQHLKTLSLVVTRQTNLAPLGKLSELRELVIGGATTSALVPVIEPLPALTRLFLTGEEGPIDTKPLAKLTRLELLDFGELPVKELAPLKALPRLERLSVWNGQVKDLKVLLTFPALKHVLLPKDAPDAVRDELRRQHPEWF